MRSSTTERGVTLIELLVSIAVLSLVLAGIYTLLNSAFQTYLNVRRRSESQQTAKAVTDYVVQRLREIDGAKSVDTPWNCTGCHVPDQHLLAPIPDNITSMIPCEKNVTIPNRAFGLLELKTVSLPALPGVPSSYQNMTGNYIRFQADLLPVHGFPESFSDADGDGVWDWTDGKVDGVTNGKYDIGEGELLEDMNENSELDYFSEVWTLQARPSPDGGPYYELVESLNFNSLQPQEKVDLDGDGTVDRLKYNRSVHDDAGYTEEVVAYGLVGFSIKTIPRVTKPVSPATYPVHKVEASCGGGVGLTGTFPSGGCHGSNATAAAGNIYENHSSFSYDQFMETHDWWNVKALSVEVGASSTTQLREHFTQYKQFVIPRNLEINQYAK